MIGAHMATSTSIVRTVAGGTPRNWAYLEAENDVLKHQVDELSQQLRSFQHNVPVVLKAKIQQDASSLPNRHAPWMPSEQRDLSSSNPELASILRRISVNHEIAVAVSNKNLASDGYMLEGWCESPFAGPMHCSQLSHSWLPSAPHYETGNWL